MCFGVTVTNMKSARPRARTYRMGARAQAAAETHQLILDAAIRQFGDRPYDAVGLADVAAAAGVTVQTVLRRFGSKEGLVEAAVAHSSQQVRQARWAAAAGDVDGALRDLCAHYAVWGDRVMRFLAQEEHVAAMQQIVGAGRALHHQWVDHMFAPWLSKAKGDSRRRLRAQLIAATDVYVWKILHRDLGLDPKATQRTLRDLVNAILA